MSFVIVCESHDVDKQLPICLDFMDHCLENTQEQNSLSELEALLESCYSPYEPEEYDNAVDIYELGSNIYGYTHLTVRQCPQSITLHLSDGQETTALCFGNAKAIKNDIYISGLFPQLYCLTNDFREDRCIFVGDYRCVNDKEKSLRLRFLNCPHTLTLSMKYSDDIISINVDGLAETLPETPFHISGKRI